MHFMTIPNISLSSGKTKRAQHSTAAPLGVFKEFLFAEKLSALSGVVESVFVNVAGEFYWLRILDMYFDSSVFYRRNDFRIGGNIVFGRTFNQLFVHPISWVAQRCRSIHFLLHQVLEEIGIIGDRDIHISGISHDRNYYDEH